MDFADPSSMLVHADKALLVQQDGNEWGGWYVADPAKRTKFATDIVIDLETIFTSGGQLLSQKKGFFDRKSSDTTALGSDAARRLEKGMVKGAKVLVKYIDERLSKKKDYPESFLDRAKVYRAIA